MFHARHDTAPLSTDYWLLTTGYWLLATSFTLPPCPSPSTSIRAARRIDDVIYHSPCNYSLSLSRLCGAEIYCKLDHLQVTGSFKERGAGTS